MNNITLILNKTNQYIYISSFLLFCDIFDDFLSHRKDVTTSKTKIRKFQVKFSLDCFFFLGQSFLTYLICFLRKCQSHQKAQLSSLLSVPGVCLSGRETE